MRIVVAPVMPVGDEPLDTTLNKVIACHRVKGKAALVGELSPRPHS